MRNEHSGPQGKPIAIMNMTLEENEREIAKLLAKAGVGQTEIERIYGQALSAQVHTDFGLTEARQAAKAHHIVTLSKDSTPRL